MGRFPRGRQRFSVTAAAAVGLVTALVASSCASGAGTKAGAGDPPLTLRLGTDDSPGRPSEAQISRFADEVADASNGRVRVEPRWQAAGDTRDDDSDQKVARLVVSGDLDLALVPARAWDTEGVSTLRVLNAPFLITSGALSAAVVRSTVADQMLGGLDVVGVKGLALVPEDVRFVMSFTKPLVGVRDFRDAVVRVPASRTTYASFAALGARPDDVSASGNAMLTGEVTAVETQFSSASTFPRFPLYATGNLPLWPKVNALVVNAAAYARLDPDVQRILLHAARATRDWSVARPDQLDADVERYCAAGGTVVFAGEAEVAALHEATGPVIAGLERDPATRVQIETIRTLARETGDRPDVAPPCGPAPTVTSPPPTGLAPGRYAAFPEGVYRAKVPADFLRRAGIPESQTRDHAGQWTLTFEGGTLSIEDANDATGAVKQGGGSYCATTTHVAMSLDGPRGEKPTGCGGFLTARWATSDDRLRLTEIRAPDPDSARLLAALFGSMNFQRVR